MELSATLRTATTGMSMQAEKLGTAARSIANPDTAAQADPMAAMLDVIEADIGYRANASVFETGADLWDVLLSIKRD